MANEISLVTASGSTVTPKDDGIIYEVFSPGNGLIYGGVVSIKDSSTLHITAGHGIVCGRKFTIDDADIPVVLSGSGTLNGRLYIHLDLADVAEPIALLVETGSTLSPEVRDSDVNINNGVYDINIATFTVSTTTIADLVNIDNHIAPIDFGTADISGIGDGSIKGAISELNADMTKLIYTFTGDGVTTYRQALNIVYNAIKNVITPNSFIVYEGVDGDFSVYRMCRHYPTYICFSQFVSNPSQSNLTLQNLYLHETDSEFDSITLSSTFYYNKLISNVVLSGVKYKVYVNALPNA